MQTGTADAITLADKITVAEDYVARITAASVPFTHASAAATMAPVSGLGNSPTTAAEVTAAELVTTQYISPVSPGQTFSLTTGVDIIPGLTGSLGTTDTSGNDIIVGQNTGAAATWTMNPADQINAGGGANNQFKLFSGGTAAEVAQAQFPTLTNVEGLWINHFGNNVLDLTTSQFAQLTAVQLDNINGGGGGGVQPTLIVANQAVTLSNDATGGNLYDLASAVDISENVTLNTVGTFGAHSTLNAAFDFGTQHSSHTVTELTISSTGGPNFVDYESGSENPLQLITFAHSASGDTNWTGRNFGSTHSEVIDASAFTAQWIGGTPGGATAANPFGTPNTRATGFGDSGSSFGDTIKLGSGASFLAEHGVADGNTGDVVILLAGHTALNVIDTTDDLNPTYSTAANEIMAMTTVTNFNLSPAVAPFGDVLKMGIDFPPVTVGSATDIGGTWTNVAGHAGFVTGGTAAQFEAAVWNAGTRGSDHVIAYTDGTNTYVAIFDLIGGNGESHIIELVGVHTAAGLSLDGTLANSIHIA
jgi:hypothetical protein